MRKHPRLIVLGIDAANPELLLTWAAEGKLPHIAALIERGRTGRVTGVQGFFTGATWPTLLTSRGPGGHGVHYLAQLKPGTYDFERVHRSEYVRAPMFWEWLTRAGKKLALCDLPFTAMDPTIDGLQTVEWGGHDALFGFHTWPPELRGDVQRRHGTYPVRADCDRLARTPRGFRRFADDLVDGAERRARLGLDLLSRGPWDLFFQVFHETHCIGHQCWHLHDRAHPGFDGALAEALGNPMLRVYQAIDRGIGSLLDAAPEAAAMIVVPHSMSHAVGSHLLLPQLLVRLGLAQPPPLSPARRRTVGDVVSGVVRRLPQPARSVAKRLLERPYLPGQFPLPRLPVDPASSQCIPLPNGLMVSGIRFNLVGREPQGRVPPEEVDCVFERLRDGLMELRHESTGAPVVRRVLRTTEVTSGDYTSHLPDVLIEWGDETPTGTTAIPTPRGATIRASSPRVGSVEATNRYGRTGEHRVEGLMIASGAGIDPAGEEVRLSILDIAPTIASTLGVALTDVEGNPVDELLPRAAPARQDV